MLTDSLQIPYSYYKELKKKVKTMMESLRDKINLNTYVNSSLSLRYFIWEIILRLFCKSF